MSRLPYRICLLILLILELVALVSPFDTRADLGWSGKGGLLFMLQHGIRPTLVTGLIAYVLFAWPVLADELRRCGEAPRDGRAAIRWLVVHTVVIVPLVVGSTLRRPGRIGSMAEGVAWVFGWAILGMAALISAGLASLPVRFWRRLVKRSRRELINACGLGVAAYLLGIWSERLWGLLQGGTFAVVVLLLKLVGLTIQTDPAQYMISTPNFAVDIAPLCSGIEGIGLVAVFLAVYLWLYRIELRFPHALVLLPAGMLLIWLLNGVRIAALILLGSFAPEAATRGFHSVAGWLFFNSVICGLVAASRHLELFRTSGGSSKSLSV